METKATEHLLLQHVILFEIRQYLDRSKVKYLNTSINWSLQYDRLYISSSYTYLTEL